MVKWTLVLIYGRLRITAFSQGKIIFEIQMRILFNEVPGEIFTYSSFSRSVKKKWVTSGFGLKVILGGYLFVSGHCTLQLSFETRYKIAYGESDWNCCCSSLIHIPFINTIDELAEIVEGWRYL